MAYYKIDTKRFARLIKEAQMFQDDIVCAVGTDFMTNIAEAENRMIFDILKGIESEATADVVEVVRCKECENYTPDKDGVGYCVELEIGVLETDFCSFGERKDT